MAGGKIVSSLSWLPTHLAGSLFENKYTVGQIVMDIIFAIAIASLFALTRGPKKIFDVNPQSSRGLLLGIIALLLWYGVTIIDLFLHEARILVPYNYFFIDVAISSLKFCAEGYLVATTYRIVVLHLLQQTRKAKIALLMGEVLNLVLLATAIYSIGSLIARQIVWLQLEDEKTRNGFAWPQRKFEAAFYGIQFCMGFLATVFAGLNLWISQSGSGDITDITHRLFWAALSLWIWCTSEMAFVVKYHLGNRLPAKNTALARDIIYGLFTLIFYVLIAFDGTSARERGADIGAQLPPHLHPILTRMKAAARTYVVEQLQARTQDNEKPPPFKDLIRDLRRMPNAPFRGRIREERTALDAQSLMLVDERYREYVTEMEGRYGHLECTQVAREF